MRKLFFLLYAVAILVFSCRESRPEGVLAFEKMRSVMWDMMRADQFMADHIFARDSLANKQLVSEEWYGKVLALHKISQEDFRKSYDYYSARPQLLKDLMDSISKQVDTSTVWQPRPIDTSRKDMRSATAQ